MEQILTYVKNHGLPVFIIASCIIAVIGILKLCKVFNKIENKNVKKLIYFILDVALSFGGAAIYYAIFNIGFDSYIIFSATQISSTLTLYQIYENIGARKLWQIILAGVAGWFKKNPDKQLAKIAKAVGLEEFIAKTQATITAEQAKKTEAQEVK